MKLEIVVQPNSFFKHPGNAWIWSITQHREKGYLATTLASGYAATKEGALEYARAEAQRQKEKITRKEDEILFIKNNTIREFWTL